MRFLKKIFSTFLLFLLLFVGCKTPVFADENFDKSLNSTYTISNLGLAKIEHTITVTNKTPLYYISQYALKISSTNLENIQVSVDGQPLSVNVTESNHNTSIAVTFPDKVVGQDKKRTLVIKYDNPDSTVVTGNTLAVYVPKLADKDDYQDYSLTIYSPKQYGYPTRTYPLNHFSSQSEDKIKTEFKNIKGEGISTLFGSTQIFDLTLRYNLENTTSSTGQMQIALPPDASYQKMYYIDINPPPLEIKTDLDGNWIATYLVEAQSNKVVHVTAKAKITLEPNLEYPAPAPLKTHVEKKEFWPVDDEQFQDLAQSLKTAKNINDYVTSHLTYNELIDLGRKRLGAKQALIQNDQAICQEFTDSFITIARAAKIPSRRITGYAYSENSSLRPLSLVEDILHSWPEYFDQNKKIWQPIDPTWENTTGGIDYFNQFDLNHIVFAINGLDSSLPYSAGSYKLVDQNTKDVEVRFSDNFPDLPANFNFNLTPKKIGELSIPGIYELSITNQTGQAFYQIPLQTSKLTASSIYINQALLTNILPLQTVKIPVYISSNSIIPHREDLTFYLYGQQQTFNISGEAGLNFIFRYSPIVIGMGAGIIVATLTAGSILVFRLKK